MESIRLLIYAGADVNSKHADGITPLMYAFGFHGSIESIRLLIDSGSDVNSKTVNGITPLMIALKFNNPIESIRLLIDSGADVNSKCVDGWRRHHIHLTVYLPLSKDIKDINIRDVSECFSNC